MAPSDFPVFNPPGADAAVFIIPKDEARRLVRRVAFAISKEETRYYLNGVYLTNDKGQLCTVATDGYRLSKATVAVDPGTMSSVILPAKAIAALDQLARGGDVTVRVTQQRVELVADDRRVVSKLIDATFPDYARLLPATSNNSVTVEAEALLSAARRLNAILEAGAKDRAVGLSWDDGKFSVSLPREDDAGVEEVEPIAIFGSGRVAVQAHYLIEQIEALDGETVVIDHASAAAPISITRPDEPATITISMPLRWARPAVEAPAEQPRRRAKGGR
jgi:DNA polymerase III subunit beta